MKSPEGTQDENKMLVIEQSLLQKLLPIVNLDKTKDKKAQDTSPDETSYSNELKLRIFPYMQKH